MDCAFMLWLFAVSIVASAFGGILGIASGIFIVPILTMFGHVEIHTAIGAGIVSVIACSCGGSLPHEWYDQCAPCDCASRQPRPWAL
jgi:uncharacterized membrane protein YfcA